MKISWLFFLLLFFFVPNMAHADIFAQLVGKIGGCGMGGAGELDCSTDFKKGLFSAISCKVLKVFNAGVVPLYCNIVTSTAYLSALNAIMVIFVIIWGISFLIGSVPTTTGTAMVNLLKMAFIYYFCTNTDLFFNFLYANVLGAPAELVRIILGSADGSKDFYSYVDKHISEIFHQIFQRPTEEGATTQKIDMRLFVLGVAVGKLVPGGGFITAIFFAVISGWLMTYVTIMVRYIIAIMALIFLLMLMPIFLPAKLFKAMDYMTEEWIKMIISFIIQIVVVVTFLIMIEPFFVDFMELIKLGFNEIVLEKGQESELVSQGQTMAGNAVEAVYQKTGITVDSAHEYVTQLNYKGNKDEFVPWFMFMLLQATVVIYLSYHFMQEVPRFAGLIAGNPKFISIMQAEGASSFGTNASPVGLPVEKTLENARKSVGNAITRTEPAPPPSQRQSSSKEQAETTAGINAEKDDIQSQ